MSLSRRDVVQRRRNLPIFTVKDAIIEKLRNHQVVIVQGDTGSGKSTQIPQYLYEAGYATCGRVGCTQPRRIAAKTLAARVSEEVGCELGTTVGYKIRFDHNAASNTSIIYMTDGMLLQEIVSEPLLESYSCVMVDEAHERSLSTDILCGLLKALLRRRPNLKIIIASATLDTGKFSTYFNNAPVFRIAGRTFPVDVQYLPAPDRDHVNLCARMVMHINSKEEDGDILVFLEGQQEIEACSDSLSGKDFKGELWILPFYGTLPMEEQDRVFQPVPSGYKRKVVLATNIAETSLTIDGIVFVLDSGFKKERRHDSHKRLNLLQQVRISQTEATQRAGRAGRTRPGKCFRLYSTLTHNSLPSTPVPEIQRCTLENELLLLIACGVEDVTKFDFMDQPPRANIAASLTELQDLEALDSYNNLTTLGREMSKFPVEPKLAKVLITSVELGCTDDILTIVSILSVQSTAGQVLPRQKNKYLGGSAHSAFFKPEGDHLTLLNVYKQWNSSGRSQDWCRRSCINAGTLEEAEPVRDQLRTIMDGSRLYFSPTKRREPDGANVVQKCILSGYFSQIARKSDKYGYMTFANPTRNDPVYIHPSSALFKRVPEWVIYEDVIHTGKKPFMTNVMAVKPSWVQEYAPKFYTKFVQVFPRHVHNY